MKNGVWKKFSLIVIAIGFLFIAIHSSAIAQDGFREFDRKMVVTPAELFDALSTFRPDDQRQPIDGRRLKEMENAGREFLSKLSPEQQEKAWEFAEKYLRKNGVDSASSKQLMKEFGLPPDMQNELAKQFRKFGKRSSDPNARGERNVDDGISELLRKAQQDFQAESRKEDGSSEGVAGPSRTNTSKPDANAENGQQRERASPSNSAESSLDRNREDSNPASSSSRQSNTGKANQDGQQIDSGPDDPFGYRKPKPNRADSQSTNPFDAQKPRTSSAGNRATNDNQNGQPRLPTTNPNNGQGETAGSSEVDLDQLLERLGKLRKQTEGNQQGSAGESGSIQLGDDPDWEKVIAKLAEKSRKDVGRDSRSGSDGMRDALQRTESNGDATPGDQIDEGLVDRVKNLISGSLDPDKKSNSGGVPQKTRSGSSSNEKLGTRFDRLLVKAVERTLTSTDKNQGVTKSVGSVFGNLIERIQEQATKKKEDREKTADNSSADQNPAGTEDDAADNSSNVSGGNNSNDGASRDSGSPASPSIYPSMPEPDTSSFDPKEMLDSIRNLSSINPTQVFTFFAVAGFLLFAGYLLAQSFTGSQATVSKRKVIKQIRKTTIQSPKDLVETIDVFLLAKFGIKSSWWNARIAQTVLKSGSPELQARVDDLMREYVRARYMRADIQIPAADQQRLKKTLEELSMLDIGPKPNLQTSATSAVLQSSTSMEG